MEIWFMHLLKQKYQLGTRMSFNNKGKKIIPIKNEKKGNENEKVEKK